MTGSGAPRPDAETLTALEDLARHLTGGHEMRGVAQDTLRRGAHDAKGNSAVFLAALSAHKMSRMARLLKGLDVGIEYLSDPRVIASMRDDPTALRKHIKLLKEIELRDLEFLQDQADGRRGSAGASVMNAVVNVVNSSDVPDDVTTEGRRTIGNVFLGLQSMLRRGALPKPPHGEMRSVRARLIEATKQPNRRPPHDGDAASAPR